MEAPTKVNFVHQQGFPDTEASDCPAHFSALMFQPRITAIVVVAGLAFQSWPVFMVLAAILWWNVLVPTLNPFDALYNWLIVGRRGTPRLVPAPAPRRFAQGMAGTFMLAISSLLFAEWQVAAFVVEGLLVAALTALVVGRFCLGSYIFHLLRGHAAFANHTLPWAHSH